MQKSNKILLNDPVKVSYITRVALDLTNRHLIDERNSILSTINKSVYVEFNITPELDYIVNVVCDDNVLKNYTVNNDNIDIFLFNNFKIIRMP